MIFSKSSAINGFDMSLPVAVCSGLVNYFGGVNHLGKLNTKYGFPLPLPQAIHLWASQLLGIHKEKSMVN